MLGIVLLAIDYKNRMRDSLCVEASARKTSREFKILLTARNDFMKKDSNNIDKSTIIPINMVKKNT
jgi:hypothetical protein